MATLASEADLLLEPLAMRFYKGATAQDHSITEVANFATQPLLGREFALLLINNLLSLGQFKSRRLMTGGNRAPQKQMLAIL